MQDAFDFTVPPVDPQRETFAAPIQPQGSLRSRHASSLGAQAVQPHVGRQMAVILETYQARGALNDAEVEAITGIDRSSVIPRRRELEKQGLVVAVGFRVNPTSGKNNVAFDVVRSV